MNKLLLATVFAISTSSFAMDITGVWTGTGEAHDSDGQSYPECSFNFEFAQSKTEFNLISGNYNCGFTRDYSPFTVEIQGNDLIINGQKIGEINGNKVHAVASGNGFSTEYTFELIDSKLNYQEVLRFVGESQFITVNGVLSKQ